MKARLDFGAELDLASGAELRELGDRFEALWRDYASGLKHIRLPVMRGTVDANGNLNVGMTEVPDQPYCGPQQGFVWRVLRVSVYGLTVGQDVELYFGDPGPTRFVDSFATSWTSNRGLLLKPGDYLSISGAGLTVGADVAVNGEAIEAPAEQIFKLIGG